MTEESRSFIKEAIKEGDLIQARKLLFEALKNETQPEGLSPFLGELAYKFKQQGLFENAVEMLDKKCKLTNDRGDKAVLKLWLEELDTSGWFMARRNSQRTSRSMIGNKNSPLRFHRLWNYSFPNGPIPIQETINFPSPIIARDMLITFNEFLEALIGLSVKSGVVEWESGIVTNRFDYSMTSVYIRPYLFLAVPGSLKRILMYNSGSAFETVESSEHIQMSAYSVPVVLGKVAIFTFLSHVFVYDHEKERGKFYSISLRTGEMLRAPIVCNNDLFFLSNFGRIFQLPKEKDNPEIMLVKELPCDGGEAYSAPCTIDDAIYFETVNKEGLRRVGCYIPNDNRHIFGDLKDEFCNASHSHLNFTPISAGDGALFCSDTYPRLYKAKQVADVIEIVQIKIRTHIPSININPLSQIYSSTLNSYLVSKSLGGFLYVNLMNGIAAAEVFQPQQWEMVSQPIFYGNKILFVCREGVMCYEVA